MMLCQRGALRLLALLCMCAAMGCAGVDDHIGAYDGTWTDTFTANGRTNTLQSRMTLYLLEAEEGAAIYVPSLDCVMEASFDGGALEVDGQRCSKTDGSSGYDYRFDGDGVVEEGELELDLTYSATITDQGRPVELTGKVDFKGDWI